MGKTNGAHQDFVEKLKGVGHTEVHSLQECDYLLVFLSDALPRDINFSEAVPGKNCL